MTPVTVQEPGLDVREFVQHRLAELALVALRHEIDVEGELDDGPLPGRGPVAAYVTEPASHTVAEAEREIAGEAARAVAVVEVAVEFSEKTTLCGCPATPPGGRRRWCGHRAGEAVADVIAPAPLHRHCSPFRGPATYPSARCSGGRGAGAGAEEGGDGVYYHGRRVAEDMVQMEGGAVPGEGEETDTVVLEADRADIAAATAAHRLQERGLGSYYSGHP